MEIRKLDQRRGDAVPKPRRVAPEVILRKLGELRIGDSLLETTDGWKLVLRRVARPDKEQARIWGALNVNVPQRLTPDREM